MYKKNCQLIKLLCHWMREEWKEQKARLGREKKGKDKRKAMQAVE